jgi:hypothetical protein
MNNPTINLIGKHEKGTPYKIKETEHEILIKPKKLTFFDILFSLVFFGGIGAGIGLYLYEISNNVLVSSILFFFGVIISIIFVFISRMKYNREVEKGNYFIYKIKEDITLLPRYNIKENRKNIKLEIVEGYYGGRTQTKAIELQAELDGDRYLILRFPSALMFTTKKMVKLFKENNIEINHNKVGRAN